MVKFVKYTDFTEAFIIVVMLHGFMTDIVINMDENCVIREVNRFYQGFIYCRYVTRFHDGGANLKSFTPVRN
jgi:hypothetical protein